MGIKQFTAYALLIVGSSAVPQTASQTGSASASSDVSPAQVRANQLIFNASQIEC